MAETHETSLALRRTDARYQLAMRAVNGLILVGCLWVTGRWLEPAWGKVTQVDVNFAMAISVTLAITMTFVGVAATVRAMRLNKERNRLQARCEQLEAREQLALDKAEHAEARCKQLEGDLERVRPSVQP
jgi:hypothetical protein